MIKQTKKEIMSNMRTSLKEYGVSDITGAELSDEQILAIADLFKTGFYLLSSEVLDLSTKMAEFQESITTIFKATADTLEHFEVIVDDRKAKLNQN